jgi:hypothetical protein
MVAPGDGEGNMYTAISMGGLMFVTAPGMLFGLILMAVGMHCYVHMQFQSCVHS